MKLVLAHKFSGLEGRQRMVCELLILVQAAPCCGQIASGQGGQEGCPGARVGLELVSDTVRTLGRV